MVPHGSFGKKTCVGDRKGRSGGDGGKIEWKSSEVNTRTMSRGQNELTGEFYMAAGDFLIE